MYLCVLFEPIISLMWGTWSSRRLVLYAYYSMTSSVLPSRQQRRASCGFHEGPFWASVSMSASYNAFLWSSKTFRFEKMWFVLSAEKCLRANYGLRKYNGLTWAVNSKEHYYSESCTPQFVVLCHFRITTNMFSFTSYVDYYGFHWLMAIQSVLHCQMLNSKEKV